MDGKRDIERQRSDFLSRLSDDFPQFYLCFGCNTLYPQRNVGLPYQSHSHDYRPDHIDQCLKSDLTWMNVLDPFQEYEEDSDDYFPAFRIYFTHVLLVMRGLRHGPQFGLPIEAFSTTKVETRLQYSMEANSEPSSTMDGGDEHELEEDETAEAQEGDEEEESEDAEAEFQRTHQTTLFSLDARAESDPPNFYLRYQCLLVLRKELISDWVEYMKQQIIDAECVCTAVYLDHAFQTSIESLVEEHHSDSSTTPQREGHCGKCAMSWLTKIRNMDEDAVCFNLTQWRCLGTGQNANDTEWLRHVGMGLSEFRSQADFPEHDPRERFENCPVLAGSSNALSEEELFDRNISLLQNQTYRTVMKGTDQLPWFRKIVWEYMPTPTDVQQTTDLAGA